MAHALENNNGSPATPHSVARNQANRLIRVAWWTVTLVLTGSFAIAIVARYDELRRPCETVEQSRDCGYYVLTPNQAEMLNNLGLSLDFYAIYMLAVDSLPAISFVSLAVFIVLRRPDDRVATAISMGLIATGLAIGPEVLWSLDRAYPGVGDYWLSLIYLLAIPAFVYVNATFPNGRFEPRWMRWAAIGMMTCLLASILLELLTGRTTDNGLVSGLVVAGLTLWLSLIAGQFYRYRRHFSRIERQQMKWVLFGLLCFAVGGVTWALLFDGRLVDSETTQVWHYLVVFPLLISVAVVLPVTMTFAILRHHLYDIDVILNRTLVYLILTSVVVATYVLVVGGVGTAVHDRGNSWLPFVAAGLIAVLIHLLRDRIQRGVNRLMFGARDEPYTVLTELGRDLSSTAHPDTALQRTVESIGSALKLPYAEIDLKKESGFKTVASYGSPVTEPLSIPMMYQGESVGRLLVSPRSPSEQFTENERRLLGDIAVQAAAVAASVQFTQAVQRARESLVFAREEERLRIRRDLHDGLGPTLATQTLNLDAAIDLLPDDPDSASKSLHQIKKQNAELIGDIRRLVYELRPPALDELHLVGAIRSHAAQLDTSNALSIAVEAQPDPLPELPAAVEVAMYRVVEEAITNVLRHARARKCQVGLRVVTNSPRALALEIEDDGIGIPDKPHSGIGMRSMRERIEELGGQFRVEDLSGGGTRISASIPLIDSPSSQRGEVL